MKTLAKYAFVFCCLLFISAENAYAYIDPGTGSMLIQVIAGIVLACGASIGIFWSRIKRFFSKKDK